MLLLPLLWALACGAPEAQPPTAGHSPTQPLDSDGYDDPIGSGVVFLADSFRMSEADEGLDIDGDGESDGVINAAWQPLLPTIDEHFQASVYSGRLLLALEMAGLGEPYDGNDPAATLKIYDCDDPDLDPTNNFCDGPGCAEVRPDQDYLDSGQSLFRTAPGPVSGEFFEGDIDASFSIDVDAPQEMTVRQMHMVLSLPSDLSEIRDGILCGVSPVADLDRVVLPLCEYMPAFCVATGVPEDLTIAEYLVLMHHDPDIDMDGDGLERFELDAGAQVAVCYDGDGTEIADPNCLYDPRMADGYSVCFKFHAIPAKFVE